MKLLLALALATQQQITLTRELVIGADPAGPEYEFAAAGPGVLTRSGSLFVAVWEGGTLVQIRQFDQAGRFQRNIGRAGSGPGEYRSARGLALSGDSLLIVYDDGSRRVSLFDTAGMYRRSFAVSGGGFSTVEPFVYLDGLIAVRALALSLPPGRSTGSIDMPTVFVRYGLDGRLIDSIPAPSVEVGGTAIGHRSLGWRWPFAETRVSALLPGGAIASATTTAYRIEVSRVGGTTFTIERDARPLPLTGAEREDWLATFNQLPGPPLNLPRHKPIIRNLSADTEGRLWVSLYTSANRRVYPPREGSTARQGLSWWEHNAYDLFVPGGRYLGRVDLPPFTKPVAILGTRIWVAEEAEDGGYVLVRYRMTLPAAR